MVVRNCMLLRAILAFLALPALVAGVFPLILSRFAAPVVFRSLGGGIALCILGSAILLAAVVSFYRRGRGTLAPWDPPKHLVVRDLYRFNRNPMYVGVIFVVVGWALFTGNLWNYAYALILPLIFHLRVVLYEEKQMELLFGEEWIAYRRCVPRWGLALRPCMPDIRPSATVPIEVRPMHPSSSAVARNPTSRSCE